MNKVLSILKKIYRSIISFLPAKIVFHIETLRGYKKFCNLKNPKYFGEKIQCLKINGSLEQYSKYADKYEVRNYIINKLGEEYLIPIIKKYDSYEDINLNELPDKFVLKLNTGSGYNYIVNDKNNEDENKIKRIFKNWMKIDYFKIKKEPQYKNIKKSILCEQYLCDKDGKLPDYKFYCFDGKAEFVEVDYERYENHKMTFYDRNWNMLDLKKGKYENKLNEKKVKNLQEMFAIAEILAKDFQFVRVDLYNLDGKIYFGELTFTPAGGLTPFKPIEKDIELAEKIKIEKRKKIIFVGSVGYKTGRLDGVTIKSRVLQKYLEEKNQVYLIDVDNYKKNFLQIVLSLIKYYFKTDTIVICSSSPGASILIRFFNMIPSSKKIYYFVCGGSFDKKVLDGKYKKKWYRKIKKMYVESNEMKNNLIKLGFSNVEKLNNFRNPIINCHIKNVDKNNIRFVFFGRVVKDKGVEQSIQLIKRLRKDGYNVFLDIIGQGENEYLRKIESLIDVDYIKYLGSIVPDGFNEYISLNKYDIFLFPTEHDGEGLPGALIDAYFAGLAVIASDWKYAHEYIKDNENGIIFKYKDYEDMYIKTKKFIDDGDIEIFKRKSLEISKKYNIRYNLKEFNKE